MKYSWSCPCCLKKTSSSKYRTWAFEKSADFITQNLEKLNFLRLLAPLLGKVRIHVGSHQTSIYIGRVHALKSMSGVSNVKSSRHRMYWIQLEYRKQL